MKKIIIAVCTAIIVIIAIFSGLIIFGQHGFGPGVADYTYKIADFCKLERFSAHVISIGCNGLEKGIEPKVVKVGWNSDYLVAITHPLTKTDPSNPNCVNCAPDELITFWWIIDLNKKEAYGPIGSEDEFISKKSKLGVGDVELLSIDDAKNRGIQIDE